MKVWLDPDGMPYGWSFTCSLCGQVYVYEEVRYPSEEHSLATMVAHMRSEHPEAALASGCG